MTSLPRAPINRWNYGGARLPVVEGSRVRPSCLGRISDDPLVFCQNTPRRGRSVCDECLGRNDRPAVLERLLRDEARRLLKMSWQRPQLVVPAVLAARLGEIRKFLRLAGVSCVDIDRDWEERFRLYRADGGRAPFVELRGYNW